MTYYPGTQQIEIKMIPTFLGDENNPVGPRYIVMDSLLFFIFSASIFPFVSPTHVHTSQIQVVLVSISNDLEQLHHSTMFIYLGKGCSASNSSKRG